MNIYKIALSAALLVLILGTSPSQFAQERPNEQDHTLALGLLEKQLIQPKQRTSRKAGRMYRGISSEKSIRNI